MARTPTEAPQAQPPSTATPTGCVHRWRIEPPEGRESAGTCGLCGATRSFVNSNSSVSWERSNLSLSAQGGPASRTTRVAEITLSDEG